MGLVFGSSLNSVILRTMLLTLVAAAFISAGSNFALAGCCTYQGICSSSQAGCPPGYFVDQGTCADQDACRIGCCCPENIAKKEGECKAVPGNVFLVNPGLVAGSSCSCASTHNIKGEVYLDGYLVEGATVSAGSIVSTTKSGVEVGQFTLEGVPASSSVLVSAARGGCYANTTLVQFSSDVAGIKLDLACACVPGCDKQSTSYCDAQRYLHRFNVSNSSQKAAYCSACADVDALVCGSFSSCVHNDGSCPLSCSPVQGSANFDSDCVCNINARNGVCPLNCDASTDLDCGAVSSPSCGDGVISYPFETCEANPRLGQASFCQASLCSNCNCISQSACGNGVIDPGEACENGNICSDGSLCSNCQCNAVCSQASSNPSLSAIFQAASRQASLSWAVPNSCSAFVLAFEAWKCRKSSLDTCSNKETFELAGSYSRVQLSASDNVLDNSVYHYFVKARYSDGKTGSSNVVQVSTGTSFCLDRPAGASAEFCLEDKRSTCDSSRNIKTVEDCAVQGKYCTGPNIAGTTKCTVENACSMCNGLYGMFAKYLDLRVVVDGNSFFCNQGLGREILPGCYYDKSKTVFSAFDSCGNVKSCYDYKSSAACTDPLDPCGKNKGCEWISFSSNPVLGGVCRPVSAQYQDCTLCDDPSYNLLSPKCNPESCSLFGACYFQGSGNVPSCTSRRVSTCNSLTTVDLCEGSAGVRRGVLVDSTYNISGARVAGSHALSPSNDANSLGKCYWDAVNLKCRRDADGLRVDFERNWGFDCPSQDLMCESDFSSPLTTILNSQAGLFRAAPTIYYAVKDEFAVSKVLSYFCIVRLGQLCYPLEQGVALSGDFAFVASRVNESGQYSLFYYSIDPAKNLELVKNTTILVDADPPFINIISPATMNDLAVNNATFKVEARTSVDASFVCANNTFTKRTVCINNCNKPGSGTPCINSQGYFNLTIQLTAGASDASNVTRNVLFYAEDYAGNRYSNTMLGILFDITPPDAPTIIIK